MILLLSFDVQRRGGIERLSLQVQQSLKRQGQQVVLLTPRPLTGVPKLGRLLGRFRFVLALAWYLPQASQVLCMHALLLRPLGWLRSLRRRQQSLHCWIHGIEVWGSALTAVKGDLLRCQQLIASSRFTRDRVLEQTGAWPAIRVVHPMADLIDPFQPPQALPEGLRLLTVARMDQREQYKGHDLILQALRQLKERGCLNPKLQWRVVGAGDDRQRLESIAHDWSLSPWVHFLGNLPDPLLEEELRTCSLLVMPSTYAVRTDGRACGEGFGIVYLEAAQAGRASIAGQRGGHSDLIEDGTNGWLIEPCPTALADRLEWCMTHPEQLSRMGANAHRRAVLEFSASSFDQALQLAFNTALTA